MENANNNQQIPHQELCQEIDAFSQKLEKLEADIDNTFSIKQAQTFCPPHISNGILEHYKKTVNDLEATLQELKTARDEVNDDPDLRELLDECLKTFEERLKTAKTHVEAQAQSNKNMEEVRSRRGSNQANHNTFFKKTALIAAAGIVAVGVLRVLGS